MSNSKKVLILGLFVDAFAKKQNIRTCLLQKSITAAFSKERIRVPILGHGNGPSGITLFLKMRITYY